MALTCKNLLKVPYVNKMELVAGKKGLSNIILNTHVVEIPEYMDFIQKGEFVLSIGYMLKNDKKKWRDFIYRICEKGAAGLAIDAERLSEDTLNTIKQICDECECPLFIIPIELRFPNLQDSIFRVLYDEEMKAEMAEKFIMGLMYDNSPVTQSKLRKSEKYGLKLSEYYYFADIEITLDKDFEINNESRLKQTYRGVSGNVYTIYDKNPIEQIKAVLYSRLSGMSRDSYIIPNGDKLSLLLRAGQSEILGVMTAVMEELDKLELEYRIGVSSKLKGIEGMNTYYEQAVFARKNCGANCGAGKKINFYESLGIEAIINDNTNRELLSAVCTNILGPVLELEEDKRNEILTLLESYFENNCNYEETAKVMFCHSNTIRNRICDIEKRLGLSHTSFNDMFNLKLALTILRNNQSVFSHAAGSL